MKKWSLFFAGIAASILMAAVDADRSYFTVSTHQPGVNTPVEIKVFLRDEAGNPCDVPALRSKPAAEFKRIEAGVYRCEMTFSKVGEAVTLQIFAGKARIRENLLPERKIVEYASASTNRPGMAELAHENGRLRIINLTSERVVSSWTFGAIESDSFLRDRRYLLSADVESVDVVSGKGAALFMRSRNAQGKIMPGRYGRSVRNEKLRSQALLAPRGEVVRAEFGIHSSYSEGKTYADNPHLEVIPTFIVRETPGVRVSFTPAESRLHIYKNYRAALTGAMRQLEDAEKKAGSTSDVRGKLKIKNKIDAATAFELKKAIDAAIKKLEGVEVEKEKNRLSGGILKFTEPRLLGEKVRAIVAPRKGTAPEKFDRGFVPFRGSVPEDAPRPGIAAAYDDTNLYVTVYVPGKAKIFPGTGKHDDRSIWKRDGGDRVELFLNTPGTRGYAQLAVGPGGQRYDEAEGDAFVNFKWSADVEFGEDDFTVRYTIPWSEFGIDISRNRELRMNCSVSKFVPGKQWPRVFCWSFASAGFREYDSMGFVVLDKFPDGVTDYIAYRNDLIRKEHAAAAAAATETARRIGANGESVSFNWNEDESFEKDTVFQMRLLGKYAEHPAPAKLDFRAAVNEFAHRAFVVGALAQTMDLPIALDELKSPDGKVIPAKNLSLCRVVFLEPDEKLWKGHQKWSGRPLPELWETVSDRTEIKPFSLALFRLYIDTRDCQPGSYRGRIRLGKVEVPVACEIMPVTLPRCEEKPVNCYIFTSLPWGGASGEAWAKLLQEHYVGDVSFEHPKIYVDGKLATPHDVVKGKYQGLPWRWDGYRKQVMEYRTPAGAKLSIDGKLHDFDERIRICAKYNLRIVLSNRAGFLYPDHLPFLLDHLKKLGLPPRNFTYKLGDEDPGPYFLPVAKFIRAMNLGININMIPSGAKYWDVKPLMEGFTCMDYSQAAFSIDEQGRRDLQAMRKAGFPIRRYTNRTSWAERQPAMSGRRDLWDVVIGDDLDGMVVWTGSPHCWLNFAVSPRAYRRVDWRGLPPEHQTTCQLVYWRKQGDFIKPISSQRLEDLRDGVTDALYYRAARRELERRGDGEGLRQLAAIVARRKHKFSDYETARMDMVKLILRK